MRLFGPTEIKAAYQHAGDGHQALYVRRKSSSAWLIDHDIERLISTAKRLGVQHIYVGRARLPGQYIELKNATLDRATAECAQPELVLR